MTDTMLERMAKAIGGSLYGGIDPIIAPNTWACAMKAAKDALLAIREPTSKARLAGGDAWRHTGSLEDVWQAVIDHILNEEA